MSKKTEVITFGCRLNAYESEIMRKHAAAAGTRDQIIINTCAVTKEAERQARQEIRRKRRECPHAEIVVTGCSAQIDPHFYREMAEVDRVIGNMEKLNPESYVSKAPMIVNNIMSVRETAGHLIDGFSNRTRAYIQVQQGCDHRCTFCIIPFGRGNSRSVPIHDISRQLSHLLNKGYLEVVLSGVDISSYGSDLPGQPTLGQMVKRVLSDVPGICRLRISSIDCIEIDSDLKRLIAEEERLMPHLHLSLQSGDDLVLKRMKRRHTRGQAIELCAELRRIRPDIVFGADLIVGFPTETEMMFQNTLALVDDCGLTWLHVFPYSERPKTPAARMPQICRAERKERAARLRAVGKVASKKHLESRVGLLEKVLIETENMGRTPQFSPVKFNSAVTPGNIQTMRIKNICENGRLLAVPCENPST